MSYSPPVGSVDFQATGLSYSPPVGTGVDFRDPFKLGLAGGLLLGGHADIESLATWDLTISSPLLLTGDVLLHTEVGRRISIGSAIKLGGNAGIVAAAVSTIHGNLPLVGSADINTGPAVVIGGRVGVRGSLHLKTGPGISAAFKLRFGGSASIQRGVRATVNSHLSLGVSAQSTHAPEIVMQVASGVRLRGRMRLRFRG